MIEAMKQALEALDLSHPRFGIGTAKHISATAALRQAIAKLESQDGACQHCAEKGCVACDARKQEPVGEVSDHDWSTGLLYRDLEPGTPLYAHPPQRTWQGLTDEEIEEIRESTYQEFIEIIRSTGRGKREPKTFVRAIEAKLKEKNNA